MAARRELRPLVPCERSAGPVVEKAATGGLFAEARFALHLALMRPRTCLLLALGFGLLGLSLRSAMPVTPVDTSFREVIRFYDSLKLPPRES